MLAQSAKRLTRLPLGKLYLERKDMNKRKIESMIIILLFLAGCNNKATNRLDNTEILVTPSNVLVTIEITREVTRIIKIYPSSTPSIQPTPSCYDTAKTQYDLNKCSWSIEAELRSRMEGLVQAIAGRYSKYPERKEEFLKLQEYWQINAENECNLWYGQLLQDPKTGEVYREFGTMAPLLVSTCMIEKYESRIKELHNVLHPTG
jgi:hypothetical protein